MRNDSRHSATEWIFPHKTKKADTLFPLGTGVREFSSCAIGLISLYLCASAFAQTATPEQTTAATPTTEQQEGPNTPEVSPIEAAGLTEAATLATEELAAPQITPGPPITLAQALEKAEKRNLDLRSAQLEIDKAKAGLSKSWGLVLPYVQAKMEYTRMDHADEVDFADSLGDLAASLPPMEPLLTNPQDKLTGAIQVSMPLIDPEAWMQIRTAKKGVEVVNLSIEDAKRQILMGTAQAYFMVLTTRDLINFHFEQMKTSQEQLRVANARFNGGRAMRIDVIRAETDFERARQSLLSASLSFDNARDTLGQLVGMTGLPLPSDSPTLTQPTGDQAKMESRAKQLRTDIRSQSATLEMLERQKKAVWMQFVPKLDMAWQGSYQFTDLPDMGSDDRSRWALMVTLTVPLYNHFRYAELDEKRAAIRQAELKIENIQQKAGLAVRKARRNYTTALIEVTTAEKQAALAKEGITLTEAAYRNGRGTSVDVTLARQAYTGAGLNLTTSQFKAQLALLALLDAIGEDIPTQIK